MANRTYLITVDLFNPTLELDAFKAAIQASPLFETWWNHIPGVFLVVSSSSAGDISQALRPYTKEARLLVIEANLASSDGMLPEQSWDWIRRRSEAPMSA